MIPKHNPLSLPSTELPIDIPYHQLDPFRVNVMELYVRIDWYHKQVKGKLSWHIVYNNYIHLVDHAHSLLHY